MGDKNPDFKEVKSLEKGDLVCYRSLGDIMAYCIVTEIKPSKYGEYDELWGSWKKTIKDAKKTKKEINMGYMNADECFLVEKGNINWKEVIEDE